MLIELVFSFCFVYNVPFLVERSRSFSLFTDYVSMYRLQCPIRNKIIIFHLTVLNEILIFLLSNLICSIIPCFR